MMCSRDMQLMQPWISMEQFSDPNAWLETWPFSPREETILKSQERSKWRSMQEIKMFSRAWVNSRKCWESVEHNSLLAMMHRLLTFSYSASQPIYSGIKTPGLITHVPWDGAMRCIKFLESWKSTVNGATSLLEWTAMFYQLELHRIS